MEWKIGVDSHDELYHHGVKGMKWGRRRYQNKDGSLTPAGIKRYAKRGYSSDAYKSNKTAAGKAYDKITNAHKYAGGIRYDISTDKERKARAEKQFAYENRTSEQKKADKARQQERTKQAVKDYRKQYDRMESASNKADEKWAEAKAQRKKIGKTPVTRLMAAIKNDTEEAKRYNKLADEASNLGDAADREWLKAQRMYYKTGKNRVSRILNNVRY